jgi:hypothetical protein
MAVMASPASAPAGSAFGLPGITKKISQKENNDGVSVTLASGSQVSQTGLVPFKQSDVIRFYEMQHTISQTITAGSATVTLSPYFPYNYMGPGDLNMQSQFQTLKWLSGIDLAIWQSYRPMIQTQFRDALYQLPRSNAYSAPTNLVSAANYTSGSTTLNIRYELPVSLWFDLFFPLDASGTILAPGQRALVSPQFMSGTQRVVQPDLTWNQIATVTAGANGDQSPFVSTGTQTGFTAVASVVTGFRRNGYYQPQGAQDSPPVYNWAYTRRAYKQTLAGVSSITIPIPANGQILSIFLRFFDPSSGATGGAAIPMANITECDLQYGPGLFKFQDKPVDMQARFIAQHGILPFADGVLIWDMAQDDFGRVTNADVLNTMNTSGVQASLTFSGSQSATAYVVVGVEALQWVNQG